MAFIVNTNRSSLDNCSNLCSANAPEIEVDKSLVHGGVGEEAVISCIVYGDPPPNVRWYRETMVLARNENRLMEQFGIRHRVVIARVSESVRKLFLFCRKLSWKESRIHRIIR